MLSEKAIRFAGKLEASVKSHNVRDLDWKPVGKGAWEDKTCSRLGNSALPIGRRLYLVDLVLEPHLKYSVCVLCVLSWSLTLDAFL